MKKLSRIFAPSRTRSEESLVPTIWAATLPYLSVSAMSPHQSSDALSGKPPISAVILTRNEQAHIAAVLENLADLADQLIVIDMHSEDETVRIANRYTSHVYSHPLITGFNAARNLGHEHALHEWILVVDADERLPDTLREKLREVVNSDLGDYVAIQRLNFVLGHPLRHGDYAKDWQTRFYKKHFASPWPESVHQEPQFHGRKLSLPDEPAFTIQHYTSPTIDALLSRLQRYTRQDALILQNIDYRFSALKLLGQPTWSFFRAYILKQGFRDGIPGLIYAVYYAFYFFLVRARFWENARSEKLSQQK